MFEFLVDKGLEAFQHHRDSRSLLRLLYLECRTNLTVLEEVVDELGKEPTERQLEGLSQCLSTDALGAVFVVGSAQDAALDKLRGISVSKGKRGEVALADALANVFVRANATMRLADMRGAELASGVAFKRRVSNLRKDYLLLVRALAAIIED